MREIAEVGLVPSATLTTPWTAPSSSTTGFHETSSVVSPWMTVADVVSPRSAFSTATSASPGGVMSKA
jgi:hypothetical protein